MTDSHSDSQIRVSSVVSLCPALCSFWFRCDDFQKHSGAPQKPHADFCRIWAKTGLFFRSTTMYFLIFDNAHSVVWLSPPGHATLSLCPSVTVKGKRLKWTRKVFFFFCKTPRQPLVSIKLLDRRFVLMNIIWQLA